MEAVGNLEEIRNLLETDSSYSDWKSAFEYAGENDETGSGYTLGSPDIRVVPPGAPVSEEPFGRADVIEIIGIEEGENDGPDWICAGRLRDRRWFMLRAGCDYTGWDCQADGNADVAGTREDLLRYGITEREADRMDLTEERIKVIPAEAPPAHGGYPGEVRTR